MNILRSILCSQLITFLFVFTAFAQEQTDALNKNPSEVTAKTQGHEVTLGTGGTVSSSPYKNYSALWSGYPLFVYEGPYAYIRGFNAGIKMINIDFLEVSIYGGYDSTSFTPANSSNTAMRQLRMRHDSAVGGGQILIKTPYGMVHSKVEGDVLGHSNGLSGEFGYMNSFDIGDLEIIPSIGASWSDSKYNNYYYGISSNEAARSGLQKYTSESGISPNVGVVLDYSLTDNLEIYWSGQLTFLTSAIKNSPMVGRDTTTSIGMGVTYTFDVE